ncbi:MAG: hypothetical protein KF900_02545 [Bacteroidetes bacterium]|nr:hypothetical protein [Bacteroidota bacterium]
MSNNLIAFLTYAVLFSALIFYNGFFGLFNDDKISKKQAAVLFVLKLLAVPVFYLLYKKLYGGIDHLDAGIFYHDANVLNNFSHTNFVEYLKILFGLQDENENSYVFKECIVNTMNWDNGYVKDFFYNDNRIVIRIHSLLHFIAFNSYFVHALFSCFLSFVGIFFLYKSIKQFFEGKELFVLLILCFFPALWFYTGALLKESLVVFVLGCTAYQLKRIVFGKFSLLNFLWLAFLLFLSILLKPYVLCISAVSFALFFFLQKVKYKNLVFFSIMLLGIIAANFLVEKVKHTSLFEAALHHQRNFAGVANGGIFLAGDTTYIRLEYDTSLVNKIQNNPATYTIKKNVPYTYWEDNHNQDTLYCTANQDTVTQYNLVFQTPQGGSNIALADYGKNNFTKTVSAFYYSLFYPFFFNAKSIMQMLASFENLAILISLMVCFISFIKNKKEPFPALLFLFIALSVCFIIGLTTPNSGAIFRYRAPVVVFILLAGVYYLPERKT